MKLTWPLAVLLALPLTACSSTLDRLTSGGQCSSFNGDRDSFSLRVNTSNTYLEEGGALAVSLDASWLDSNLDRKSLSCEPQWQVSDPAVARVQDRTVTALKSGIVKITAVVTGSGGTKSDYFWLAVTPKRTEREPNNGTGFAQTLAPGSSVVGAMEASDDLDYYVADIPAGKSYQFTLGPSSRPTSADPFSAPSYYGDVYAANGTTRIGDDNRGYTNSSSSAQRVYFVVHGYPGNIPYVVKLELN